MQLEEKGSRPLAGGIIGNGYQCGMLWGATLAAGAQAYRLYGPDPKAETAAVIAAQRLAGSLRALYKHIDCFNITESKMQTTWEVLKFFVTKGGPVKCFSMTAKYAREAFSEINAALSEEHIEAVSPPVSCAAMLARKMGLSDIQTVMAAGFAGGIGLSGSGCGALGTAIWIIGMQSSKDKSDPFGFKNPIALDTVDRFLKCSDYKYRCSEIVGHKFENVSDHAEYLRCGGCSEIIEVLAANSHN